MRQLVNLASLLGNLAKLETNTTGTTLHQHLGEFALEAAPTAERLPPMLFLAAMLHGILIIGVTFNAEFGGLAQEVISLEVTIIADPQKSYIDTEEAEYLAQASQRGEGNTTESVRPGAPAQSDVPIDNLGNNDGDSLDETMVQIDSADQLVATRTESIQVTDKPREDPAPDAATAIALEAGVYLTRPLPLDRHVTLQVTDENPRHLVTSVDTKESKIAGYLDRWKRKIETIGVKYFPEKGFTQGMVGSPTLQVTINASGQLESTAIRQSSGSRFLDQAALNILRRASPFDPFPEAIRADYDQLIFAYKWQFKQSGAAASTL